MAKAKAKRTRVVDKETRAQQAANRLLSKIEKVMRQGDRLIQWEMFKEMVRENVYNAIDEMPAKEMRALLRAILYLILDGVGGEK